MRQEVELLRKLMRDGQYTSRRKFVNHATFSTFAVAGVVATFVVAAVAVVVSVVIVPIVSVVAVALLTVFSEEGFETVFVKKFTCGAFGRGAFGGFNVAVTQVSPVDRQHGDVFLCHVVRGGHVSQSFWCRRGAGRGDARWRLLRCAVGVG